MANERSLPLLLAVAREVDRLNAVNPRYQDKGGNVVRWPTVAAVMDYLQPGCGWTRDTTQKVNRNAERTMSQEGIDALVAGVDRGVYADAVASARERGMRPAGNAPVVPGVNQHKAKSETEPELTDEEVAEKADAEIKVEQAEARARINARMYNEAKKRAAFVATACGMLRNVVAAMPEAKWSPTDIPAVHMRREQDAVLVLSDIHIGDEIHADTMGALNVYNYDVFKEKARRLYAGVKESLEMLREHGNVRRMKILGLGDWVTGTNIFPGQTHHIQFGAMKQALNGAEEMANLYMELLELPGIEEVDAEHIPGNHGRPGRKGADPFEDNWDLVLFEFMKLRLANQPRMNFNWHMSWWMMPRIRGWDFLCAHGDEVKGNLGIPNYGFRRWGSRWRELLDGVGKRYDYGVIGHHHVEVEEKNLIISGAWPGASFFSAKELQSGGEATQMFYSVSADYGITWRRRLPLDPPRRLVAVGE